MSDCSKCGEFPAAGRIYVHRDHVGHDRFCYRCMLMAVARHHGGSGTLITAHGRFFLVEASIPPVSGDELDNGEA